MEKKKLLLVAVSVGVFLVVVISASILIFTPNTRTYTAAASPVQYGTPGSSISPQERTPLSQITPVETERNRDIQLQPSLQENAVINNSEARSENGAVSSADGSSRITINVPIPSTAAVPDTPAGVSNIAATESTRKPAANANAVAVKPTPAANTAAKPGAQSATPAAAQTAAKPAARPAVATASSTPASSRNALNNYWVQTGAFSTKVRAEGVKEILAEKGITSIIENRNTEGRTLYRVRVGPYTSENEANYWLALIKSIDGFSDSQVRQTSSLR